MFTIIDNFLNKITMYRLVLYCLIFIWVLVIVLSIFNVVPYHGIDIIFSGACILLICLAANGIFTYIYKAPSNTESTYITAFILALITGPAASPKEFLFLIIVSVLAIASKYIFAINKKHIFNPAAFAVVAGTYLCNYYPSWWVSEAYLAPFVLIMGFLITRKLQRTDLVVSFLAVFIITSLGKNILDVQNIFLSIKNLFTYSPILFFTFIMLTEPATTPPTKNLRMIYGSLVALLLAPFIHVGSIYFSPELALIIGNIFSYLVSPKQKLLLQLKEKTKIATDAYEFIFRPIDRSMGLKFQPGQYLEWTLPHGSQDDRGMRRYFTIASSPTEEDLKIGVKFYDKPSSYKKTLENLTPNDVIVASQLAGEFTMPKDTHKKLVFIAGGIGITPFRSMIKYLIDTHQKRDIIIFYAAKTYGDIAYKEIFDEAQKKLGINIIYVVNNLPSVSPDFTGNIGLIDKEMIIEKVPDFQERMFYISGPHTMITLFKKTLKEVGIPKRNIKTDFFPGFA